MPLRSPLTALLALAVLLAGPAAADELEIDPAVLSVSSGPWVWAAGGHHFRAVIVEKGGRVSLHVQKIAIDEDETRRIVKTFPIDLGTVSPAVFEVGEIRWSAPDAFVFRVNSHLYAIEELDGSYEIRLAGPAAPR